MKKELSQLHDLACAVAEHFNDSRLTTMAVIIQNMKFRAIGDTLTWSEFEKPLEVLKLNAIFRPDCHVSQWLYSEAKMIIDGHFMSMEDNEEEEAHFMKVAAKREYEEHLEEERMNELASQYLP